MKAITVRQPWASLIAARVKTIETRPRPTSYRGRVAIHAAKQTRLNGTGITVARFRHLTDLCAAVPCICGHSASDHDRAVGCLVGCTCGSLRLDWPLGAVVASANLTDCVQVYEFGQCPTEPSQYIEDTATSRADGGLWLCRLRTDGGIDNLDRIEDQRPFGDFTPGRWALILDDIAPTTVRCPWCWGTKYEWQDCWFDDAELCRVCNGAGRCDPIPARGHAAVPWEWAP